MVFKKTTIFAFAFLACAFLSAQDESTFILSPGELLLPDTLTSIAPKVVYDTTVVRVLCDEGGAPVFRDVHLVKEFYEYQHSSLHIGGGSPSTWYYLEDIERCYHLIKIE